MSREKEEKMKQGNLNDITANYDYELWRDTDDLRLEENNKLSQLQANKTKYIHVFPHSHADLGWQATIDDYFEGKNMDLYIGGYHNMFDTVLAELLADNRRTFNFAEMKFFKMWWDKLPEA